MSKTITAIIIVLVLAAGGVWLFGADSNNQAPTTDTTETPTTTDTTNVQPEPQGEVSSVTVRYTQSGFSPQQVDVQSGTTVTFVNETDRPMWVASDVHPSHTQYAGTSLREHCQSGAGSETAFDQCGDSQQFSFTFDKSGEWRYHNHSIASQGGTVVVE